jgi:hypothetical protein
MISGVGFNSGMGYKSDNNKVAGSSNARHRYGKPQRWGWKIDMRRSSGV